MRPLFGTQTPGRASRSISGSNTEDGLVNFHQFIGKVRLALACPRSGAINLVSGLATS